MFTNTGRGEVFVKPNRFRLIPFVVGDDGMPAIAMHLFINRGIIVVRVHRKALDSDPFTSNCSFTPLSKAIAAFPSFKFPDENREPKRYWLLVPTARWDL